MAKKSFEFDQGLCCLLISSTAAAAQLRRWPLNPLRWAPEDSPDLFAGNHSKVGVHLPDYLCEGPGVSPFTLSNSVVRFRTSCLSTVFPSE